MQAQSLSGIEVQLEALLQDREFRSLEELAAPFNVFEVLGAMRHEIRHSNVLAWLLDPLGNHGLGEFFLERFLWRTTSLAREGRIATLRPLEVDALDLGGMVVRREWRNIDITLLQASESFVCAVENKVFSAESLGQLKRYEDVLRAEYPNFRVHCIFLTPGRIESSRPETWVAAGYDIVIDIVDEILRARPREDAVSIFLRHYIDTLRRYVMTESDVAELCQRLYSKHRTALDLIYEHRIDTQSEMRRILEQLIEADDELDKDHCSKSYIRFAHKDWKSMQLPNGSGWPPSQAMMLFQFNNFPDSLKLTLVIGPGDQGDRSRLLHCFQVAGFPKAKTLYTKWNTVWEMEFFSGDNYLPDLEAAQEVIKAKIQEFKANHLPQINEAVSGLAG